MKRLAGFFSFKGRATRTAFWQTQLLCNVFFAMLWALGLLLADLTARGAFAAISLIGVAPVLAAQLAVLCRRLHDRGKSGWWLLPFYAIPLVISLVLSAFQSETPESSPFTAGLAILALIELGLIGWGLVEVGFIRGTRGANRYGPDPAAA